MRTGNVRCIQRIIIIQFAWDIKCKWDKTKLGLNYRDLSMPNYNLEKDNLRLYEQDLVIVNRDIVFTVCLAMRTPNLLFPNLVTIT